MNHQILTAITRARSMTLKDLVLYGAEEIPDVLQSERVRTTVRAVIKDKASEMDSSGLMFLYHLSTSRTLSLLDYESTMEAPSEGLQESDWVGVGSHLVWVAWKEGEVAA